MSQGSEQLVVAVTPKSFGVHCMVVATCGSLVGIWHGSAAMVQPEHGTMARACRNATQEVLGSSLLEDLLAQQKADSQRR